MTPDLSALDATAQAELVRRGELQPIELVDAAIARMKAEGAVFTTYKTLFYELIEAVDGNPHSHKMLEAFGPFPDDLPDAAL